MTGRLTGEIGMRTRRVVYGELRHADVVAELTLTSRVDRAHLVMLNEQQLVSPKVAGDLLRCIEELAAEKFGALMSRPAPRGIYLMYEGYLIERLGQGIGGVLHTGRSRNDLKATITKLRLRDWVLDFVEQAARLQAVLLSRARVHQHVVMPVHTHFQAAMPITYGYYLLGVALAISREIDAIRTAAEGLQVCPLGAGAVAGTDLPINPERTAGLLGFTATTPHALDALASRDDALRLLSGVASLAVTLSRFAMDLQLWSTAEFGFVSFPDRLVGGSSAMPQKRNAFLLEHVRAKAGVATGAWTAAAGTMKSVPFTNSIEVGTEAMTEVWHGLTAVSESVSLSQVLGSGATPMVERMRARAEDGFTGATALANHLVRNGVAFRTAHHLVGDAVRQAVEGGSTSLVPFGPVGWTDGIDLDVAELAAAQRHGGGPGGFAAPFDCALVSWAGHRAWLRDWRSSLTSADRELADLCASLGEDS